MSTPAADGFFMPPEWAPHTRCWMAWPCRKDLWGAGLDAACDAYAEVADAISQFEPVTMIARGDEVASVSMRTTAKVATLPLGHDDSWIRDNGPSFLVDRQGGLAAVDWVFNSWGEKYKPYDLDAAVAEVLLDRIKVKRYAAPLVLEGGAFHVDGEGTLIATEQCLLNPNRNPGKSREEIEQVLRDYLGIETVIWLARGLVDDETDGHVDNLVTFVKPGVVLALTSSDADDANHSILQDALARLRAATDARGRSLEVIEVEQPKARYDEKGGRLALSYVNLYIANGGVVMPVFEDPQDQKAMDVVGKAFAGRKVVGVPALDIVAGGGGIHCITQQQPSGKPE